MAVKAVAFDIGHTLVEYPHPLNWASGYEPALRCVGERCDLPLSQEQLSAAADILLDYNTRENPREAEVDSGRIFKEILRAWEAPQGQLSAAKEAFFGFFQREARCFDDAVEALEALRRQGLKLGALTDVAYGMDNCYSLRDIQELQPLLDQVLTSVDVGFRKPHPAGYEQLLRAFEARPGEMLYVGDEPKDITGAGRLGIVSVLINRSDSPRDYGQQYTIASLRELPALVLEIE